MINNNVSSAPLIKLTRPNRKARLFKTFPILLGRKDTCDYRLKGEGISREHAIIELNDDGTCSISDLESVNGITVNGYLVKKITLKDGDIIGIGSVELGYHIQKDRGDAPASFAAKDTQAAYGAYPETPHSHKIDFFGNIEFKPSFAASTKTSKDDSDAKKINFQNHTGLIISADRQQSKNQDNKKGNDKSTGNGKSSSDSKANSNVVSKGKITISDSPTDEAKAIDKDTECVSSMDFGEFLELGEDFDIGPEDNPSNDAEDDPSDKEASSHNYYLQLNGINEIKYTIADIAQTALHSMLIYTPDLEAKLYDNERFKEAITRLVLEHSSTYIHILVSNTARAAKRGHRLIELYRRFPSSVKIRKLKPEFKPNQREAFIIIDRARIVYRPIFRESMGLVRFSASSLCRSKESLFDDLWVRSPAASEVRRVDL